MPISDLLHTSKYCAFFIFTIPHNSTILEMYLVKLVSLPFLDLHKADLLSNIIWGAYSGTIYVSVFNNSLINILKCAKAIPDVHSELYSLYALAWKLVLKHMGHGKFAHLDKR